MKHFCNSLFVAVTVLGLFSTFAIADTTIAAQDKSTFSIILPIDAPSSVQVAATELQLDIQKSTGASLPIIKDNTAITGNFISLGNTKQAERTGINVTGIAPEGFHIQTQNGNLYILGPDTTTDDDKKAFPKSSYSQYTKNGGTSNGTANGVYTFLEEYLDVRWLLPGDLGRDVPAKSTFTIPDINRTEAPLLINRRMPYLQKTAAVNTWQDRQKLGYSFQISHQHNWVQTVPAGLYQEHPDWFAMIDGKRVPPVGDKYKLESTNPELVKYFAEQAIAALKANPEQNTYSLSPSDGRGWSESPESKALYDPPAPGSKYPSITPLILKWYRDVSEIVAKEYPQGKLGGYIYTDFSQPPQKGGMTLPENFIPVIVGQDFGFRFYRKDARDLGAQLIQDWAKVAPSIWFYYGMPIWLRSSTGMLTTASPDSLNFLFKLLRENHIKGAYLYGTPEWSQTALANYIQAKLLWNPNLDANQLQHDWLTHAYGAAAGGVMEELYNKMDNGAFAEFFRDDSDPHYNVREQMFRDYYGPHYAEIEKYFLQAQSQPMTSIQKQRLQLIEDNLIVLQWRLRNAGYLPVDFASPLRRTDQQVVDLLMTPHQDFDYFPGIISEAKITPVKVLLNDSDTPKSKTAIPNSKSILLYSAQAQKVHLTPSNVHPGSTFLGYTINENNKNSAEVARGIVYSGEDISFQAKANTAYFFTITPNAILGPVVTWDMIIENSVPATADFDGKELYLQSKPAALYAYAPKSLSLATVATDTGVSLQMKTSLADAMRTYPNARSVLTLDNDWRFAIDPNGTGSQQNYVSPDFNDASWKTINATAYLQDQGFPDYHGTAWYRKTFDAPSQTSDDPQGVNSQKVLLFFGAVDGDATVYVNGKKIGEHLPSQLGKGWDQPFILDATSAMRSGQNTITVKVTKDKYKSGIYKGVNLMVAEK
jgi:hypothetical protein